MTANKPQILITYISWASLNNVLVAAGVGLRLLFPRPAQESKNRLLPILHGLSSEIKLRKLNTCKIRSEKYKWRMWFNQVITCPHIVHSEQQN